MLNNKHAQKHVLFVSDVILQNSIKLSGSVAELLGPTLKFDVKSAPVSHLCKKKKEGKKARRHKQLLAIDYTEGQEYQP